jgi:hypothetical protein
MLVRGTIGNEIKDQFYLSAMKFNDEAIEIIKRSEDRLDRAEIADIVP